MAFLTPSRFHSRAKASPPGIWLFAVLLSACSGNIGGAPTNTTPDTPGGAGASGKVGTPAGGGAGAAGTSAGTAGATQTAKAFITSPGLRRLTRVEYTNTVQDLLGVDLGADDRPKELIVQGHSEIAGAQKIGYEDTNTFDTLGQKAATAASAAILAQLSCKDAACYKTWTSDFLLRAFRGPQSATVVDRYAAMLTSNDAGDTPAERISTFLTAVLTSPHFLYRKEIGSGTSTTNKTLDGYEIASRLSYLVWQSAPDVTLLDAAKAQALGDSKKRTAELDRMLKDKRAARAMRAFVSDWMALFEETLSKKDSAVLAGTGTDFSAVARQSFDLLVDDVLAAPDTAKFTDLLRTDRTFANAVLGKIVGATVTGTQLQGTQVNPAERAGVLMHPMVLGAHTKESGASPFPIGKFIFENILCREIGPPPAMFPAVDDNATSGKTLRQRLESMTANEPCHSCHKLISPPGFAFLPFDPVGRYKNVDASGNPFDTTGALEMPDGAPAVAFTSASDLARKLATLPVVQKCIARRMFRFAYGRFEAQDDTAALNELEASAVTAGSAVAPLLRQLVAAPSFTQVRLK